MILPTIGVQILDLLEIPIPARFYLPISGDFVVKRKINAQPFGWAEHTELCDNCRSRNAIFFAKRGWKLEEDTRQGC